mgnify:CR=1 FL=1
MSSCRFLQKVNNVISATQDLLCASAQNEVSEEGKMVNLTDIVGDLSRLKFLGFQCLNCGSTEVTFRQGFCKKCFFESPMAGTWIMKPEESKAHLGIADRDLEFEKQMQLQYV